MLKLKIVSPEKVEFQGEVDRINVPGSLGNFEILTGHAPIISLLMKGNVEYVCQGETVSLGIIGGFVEVQKDNVSLCVEKE